MKTLKISIVILTLTIFLSCSKTNISSEITPNKDLATSFLKIALSKTETDFISTNFGNYAYESFKENKIGTNKIISITFSTNANHIFRKLLLIADTSKSTITYYSLIFEINTNDATINDIMNGNVNKIRNGYFSVMSLNDNYIITRELKNGIESINEQAISDKYHYNALINNLTSNTSNKINNFDSRNIVTYSFGSRFKSCVANYVINSSWFERVSFAIIAEECAAALLIAWTIEAY